MNNQDSIVSAKALEEWHLLGIMDHSIDAVIIPDYFTGQECETIAERIKKSKYFGAYPDYPTVGRLGQELFECKSELEVAKYQENALTLIKEMRRLVHPYISPVDRLRVEIDDIWKHGCNLAKLDDKKMSVGVVREYNVGSHAEPHCDVIAWDIIEPYKNKTKVINQIAVNVYLKASESGGEILLWDKWPTQNEYDMAHNQDCIGLDSKKITRPKLEITPNQGDLILFNSMRIHSVTKIETSVRMTWAFFIGYSGANEPLVIWS